MSERRGQGSESALLGHRVKLRPVVEADYPLLHAWVSRHPEAHYWRERRDTLTFDEFCRERQAESARERGSMLVEWRMSSRPIGWIAAYDLVPHERRSALSVYLTPEARAFRGADEALALFLDAVFATDALDAVQLDVVRVNVAAELLARRLGFEEVEEHPYRQWTIGNQYSDVVRLELRRAQWEDRPGRHTHRASGN